MNLDTLPDALDGAAFVSSEGRVYRLFTDDERPSLGGTFQFGSSEFQSMQPRDRSEFPPRMPGKHTASVRFYDTSSFAPLTGDDSPDTDNDLVSPTILPIDEAIRRIRAVEGTWNRRAEEPAVRLLDTMSQSATDKSWQALSSCQTSNRSLHTQTGKTGVPPEKKLLKIISTNSGRTNPESRCETNTPILERKNVVAPLCCEIVVGGKPIFLGERKVNLTQEIREVTACATDIPPGVLEQSADRKRAPLFARRTKSEIESSLSHHSKTAEKSLPQRPIEPEIFPEDDPVSPSQLSVEHWEIESYNTTIVLKTEEKPGNTRPIMLTRLAVPTAQRRQGWGARQRLPHFLQMKKKEVAEQVRTTIGQTRLNEIDLEPPSSALEAPPIESVTETIVETIVVKDATSTVLPTEEHGPVVSETVKPRQMPFQWPSKSEIVKAKAPQQIGLLTERLLTLREHARKRICFHSFLPEEGCSTMLICAARELVERGFHVLVADTNSHHPTLSKLLGIEWTPSSAKWVTLIDERFELLPWGDGVNGKPGWNPSAYTERLWEKYDFVLIDGGSLTEGEPEEKTILWKETQTDGVLLVVNVMTHRPPNLEAVDRSIRKHGAELLGVVENYVKCSRRGEGES